MYVYVYVCCTPVVVCLTTLNGRVAGAPLSLCDVLRLQSLRHST